MYVEIFPDEILLSLYYITLLSRLLSIKKGTKIRTCTLEYP